MNDNARQAENASSQPLCDSDGAVAQPEVKDTEPDTVIPLTQFVDEFRQNLLSVVSRQNPPIYEGTPDPGREFVMDGFLRDPFPEQRDVVQAVVSLLVDANEPAAIINAEMGTGKTMMAIATAAILHAEGYRKMLVLSPPHLVYKWRREIRETLPGTRVWILNGPDTLVKLLLLRDRLKQRDSHPGAGVFYSGPGADAHGVSLATGFRSAQISHQNVPGQGQ